MCKFVIGKKGKKKKKKTKNDTNEKFMIELNVLEMYRIVVRGIGQVLEQGQQLFDFDSE